MHAAPAISSWSTAPLLGVELADDSQSAGRWSLKSGGSVFAVGAGGAVVGQRADLIVIDDPLRGREEAHSESAREKLYEWYVSDLLTRLRPGGKICLISTRWHEDDLFGRLAQSGRYGIINLPAVAEDGDDPLGRNPGDYLWDSDPDYPYGEFLRAQREAQLPSNWSALFQGRPAPEEGDFFRAEFFRPLTAMPAREQLHIYGASDYAVSANQRRLYSSCRGRFGQRRHANFARLLAKTGRHSDWCRGLPRPVQTVEADRLGRGEGSAR